METNRETAAYLENVTGDRPRFVPLSEKALAGLPVYLGRTYDLQETRLFGHSVTVAFPKGRARASLARLVRDRLSLASRLGREVVLVLPGVQSYERRDLVRKLVPFIVPGRQLFLPMMLVDLRETFGGRAHPQGKGMGWVAQLILLRHLLEGGISGRPLADIAAQLGYSAMAVTQAARELADLELCDKVRAGRTKTIHFEHAPQTLWMHALEHMRSPVKRRHFIVDPEAPLSDALIAGLSALSGMTDLAPPNHRTVALPNADIRQMLSDGVLNTCAYEEDATVIVEGWAYRPQQLSTGPTVDKLSLWLSLKDDPDERVQMALTHLMEHREWLQG